MGERIKIVFFAVVVCITATAIEDGAASEERARQALAQKLLKLSQHVSMKEDKYPDSGGDVDPNAGTPSFSNTTYHKHVWDECLDWIGGQYCNQWLDPYVSKHGFGGDYSLLEGLVAAEWKNQAGQDSGSQYAIWNIQRDGGGPKNTDVDGKLDRNGITNWSLNRNVTQKIENLGESNADAALRTTYDEGAPKNTMANPEAMRMMASRYTKIYRDNMLANIGELRAYDKPVEFTLGEDKPNCESYRRAIRAEQEQTRTEERIQAQARLQPETRVADLEERYENCVKLRNASYEMVNAQVKGRNVSAGSKELEQYDKMAARVNIALIDRVGISPNSVTHPGNVAFERGQYATTLTEHDYGGQVRGTASMTNADQLNSYNQVLDWAASGYEAAASRGGGNIANMSGSVQKYKIGIGTRNMIDINSITPEMRNELSNTGFAKSAVMGGGNAPEQNLERAPASLTVKAAR